MINGEYYFAFKVIAQLKVLIRLFFLFFEKITSSIELKYNLIEIYNTNHPSHQNKYQ